MVGSSGFRRGLGPGLSLGPLGFRVQALGFSPSSTL